MKELATLSKKSILFLCTGNSCRSQMAEGIASKYLKEHLISSAGTLPEPINPNAIKSMEEIGIDISNNQSKKIDSDMLNNFDLVDKTSSTVSNLLSPFNAPIKVVSSFLSTGSKYATNA